MLRGESHSHADQAESVSLGFDLVRDTVRLSERQRADSQVARRTGDGDGTGDGSLAGVRIGVPGWAFKAGTGDLLDEDDLRVDPLEAGVEPAEQLSPASRYGTTPAELREGEPVEPVAPPESVPDRRANPDPGEQADEAGGSVADALRDG
ncbi:hypothetical protein [Amycolatopsis sp. NBC_01480]|uniref:hypothetical protein n=1 Tax=Amycolatopsis sp. NBC_01480 TaxID=2903562 RepID=UPI002E27C574|nr:hypothetical protein [Amycolatopsis sp. NBC_01480]